MVPLLFEAVSWAFPEHRWMLLYAFGVLLLRDLPRAGGTRAKGGEQIPLPAVG